jgi:hypothetical protein
MARRLKAMDRGRSGRIDGARSAIESDRDIGEGPLGHLDDLAAVAPTHGVFDDVLPGGTSNFARSWDYDLPGSPF